MSNKLSIDNSAARPFTMDELSHASKERDYAVAVLKNAQQMLDAKKAAIKSFEEDYEAAEAQVARWDATIKKMALNLEK